MPAQPNMATILTTALEVASAMAFLHEHSIVHGDLTGGDLSRLGFRVQCGISQIGGHSSQLRQLGTASIVGRQRLLDHCTEWCLWK